MSLLAALCANQWAITPDALRNLALIVRRQNPPVEAVEAELGRPLDNAHDAEIRDGIAILHMVGPAFRHANLLTQVSGATSYGMLARDLNRALADPQVKGIILSVDSPGGAVNGCSELADMIYAARGRKPIVAYVDGMGCSAAYWLASACERIVTADTAMVGSIGVLSTLADMRRAAEQQGIEELTIVSSNAPEKIHGHDGITDEAIASVRATLNAVESIFIAKVARNRGVSEKTVRETYGRGGTFIAAAAADGKESGLAAGLVDEVSTFEALLAEMAAATKDKDRRPAAAAEAASTGIQAAATASTPIEMGARVVRHESHGKPIKDGRRWDAQKEERGVRDWARKDKSKPATIDNLDLGKYEKAFLFVVGDGQKIGDYKEIHHGIRDGKLVTIAKGVYAAAQRLDSVKGISEEERAEGRRHLAGHYHEMGEKAPWEEKKSSSASAPAGALSPPRAEDHVMEKDQELHDKIERLAESIGELKEMHDKTHGMLDEHKGMHGTTHEKLDSLCEKMDDDEEEPESREGVVPESEKAAALPADIAALTGEADASRQLAVVMAWREAHARLPKVMEDLAAVDDTVRQQAVAAKESAIQAAVDIAIKGDDSAGLKPRYFPGQRANAEQVCRALGVEGFMLHLKSLPATAISSPARPPASAPGSRVELTASQKEAARAGGMTEEEYRAGVEARNAQLARRGIEID